jgi:penicillin-binding protein 2
VWWLILAAAVFLSCCGQPTTDKPQAEPTATLTEVPTATPVPPSPEASSNAFLNAWEAADYAAMYALISPKSQATIDADTFAQRYQNAMTAASVMTVTTRLESVLREVDRASAAFRVTLDTALFGTLTANATMSLSLQSEVWGIDWESGVIWPQLAGDKYFRTAYSIPIRANMYGRDGLGLATEGTIVTLGVIPGEIEDEADLLQTLASVTGLSTDAIRDRYEGANPDWKIPIADIAAEVSIEQHEALAAYSGIYRDEKEGRTYPHGEACPHVVGWVAPVPAEQLLYYRSRGYRGDEMVGVAGLEAWGEEILAGEHGGRLSIITAAGQEVAELGRREAVPGRAIHTTFGRAFQEQAQQILGGRRGAIVVLDVETGAVRGMVSGPGFDANVFVGPASDVGRSQVLTDPRHPLINRATLGTYPTGSVFKIITMSAGMEEAGLDPLASTFNCPGYWDGLGVGARKYCWKADGHGTINLQNGLSASCNVTFYNVGKALHERGADILPRFGRGFGLGEATGLVGLYEESGLMPGPEWKQSTLGEPWYPGDTVNLAIGQGYLRVTPLQAARMVAAVANGGMLYRPYIVDRIEPGEQQPEQLTEPEAVGSLPLSADHLAALQAGMLGVTTESIGTATHRFAGLDIPVAGKTGTAEAGGVDAKPHSWFVAYAPADDAEIALAVVVENAGEGSTVAAPLGRQVIEAYYGLPLSKLPPQAEEGYVPPTPTPEPQA